ncbi:peroxide stress protein YaaA [Actinomycetaceae bacterium TAE3-ERU4]|nr:peroxide stress protein YaaA [Actinomycetaceae bacterium TAE3-ERU4]
MLILLPPSEGKNFTYEGENLSPVDLEKLPFTQLTTTRIKILEELEQLGSSDEALKILKLNSPKRSEAATHKYLTTAGARAANLVYTGVLYSAADWINWPENEVSQRTFVVSALWGLVRPSDKILPYRLSMGVKLPQNGSLKAIWKKEITPVLNEISRGNVVVDMRSSDYQAVWPPTAKTAKTCGCIFVTVRVIRIVNGQEKVVSHNAKHARGELAGYLVRKNKMLQTAEEILEQAKALAQNPDSSIIDARLEKSSADGQVQILTLQTS